MPDGQHQMPIPLPIDDILDDVVQTLTTSVSVVVQAPPGAGKTTRVPVAIEAAGLAGGRQVIVLQPRRVAARAAARRIAAENGWTIGQDVGYQVRFDRRAEDWTRILVVTEGVFLAFIQRDPFLENIGAVVFDEFHERSLDLDLSLALARRVQSDARPDLRLVVMSATLDSGPVASFLGGCPVLSCEVRAHPVEIKHLRTPVEGDPAMAAARAVPALLGQGSGDVLVFLPGLAWIDRCARALEKMVGDDIAVFRLHGSLPPEEQDRALEPSAQRKVILATNIAETSVTIDGVVSVVDSGLARVLRYDRGCGLNRLETVRISRASADQRAGRAGRQGPGHCLRLWTAAEDRALREQESPEVQRLELSGTVLQLMAWGEADPRAFPWFDPPPDRAVEEAVELLRDLGAYSTGLTPIGREMACLPLVPRLARLLVEAWKWDGLEAASLTAAVLSEGMAPPDPDLATWIFESSTLNLKSGRWRQVGLVREQLLGLTGGRRRGDEAGEEALARALLVAFPDRVAKRRADDQSRALMVGGRGVRLGDGLKLGGRDLLVALMVRAGDRHRRAEAQVHLALGLEPGWLPNEGCTEATEVEFEGDRVRAFRRRRWRELVVSEVEEIPDQEAASQALADRAAVDLSSALGLERQEVVAFLTRVRSLSSWRPDLAMPQFDRRELTELLPVLCQGKRSFSELSRLPLVNILRGYLTREQALALTRDAPEHLTVPSGSRVRLQYEPGRPPVLAVRIQELFGLRETPTLAGGRVRVLLHLLAPNMRPQQVTDDLASFWANTYPKVRSELRGRYPKHHWPEDPKAAEPTKRTKARGRR